MADPIVIVDHDGTEHEFPPGFDPKRAAMIVSQQTLAAANATPLQEPTTYAGGFKKGLIPIAKAGLDTLPGIGAIVGGALSTPETLGTGTIPGVALGTAAGRGLRDLIGHATGIDAPTSPGTKAWHMAGDAALAGATQAVVPGLAEAAKAPVQTLREASEQFGSAMPHGVRRLSRLFPSLPKPSSAIPAAISPDWLAGETTSTVDPAIEAELRARGIDPSRVISSTPGTTRGAVPIRQIKPVASHAPIPRSLPEPPAGAADMVDRMAGGIDAPSRGNGLIPVRVPDQMPPPNVTSTPVSQPLGQPRVISYKQYSNTVRNAAPPAIGTMPDQAGGWTSGTGGTAEAAQATRLHQEDAALASRFRHLMDSRTSALIPGSVLGNELRKALLEKLGQKADAP